MRVTRLKEVPQGDDPGRVVTESDDETEVRMDAQTALAPATSSPVAELPRGGVPSPRSRKTGPRPAPERRVTLMHLSLEQLREYRAALAAEEGRVSYWRRILQARLDVVRAGTFGRDVDASLLRPVLTAAWVSSGRRALIDVLPDHDVPPLPRLDELWERQVHEDDLAGRATLDADLHAAEQQLSSYRSALHAQIEEATGELIARYREQPTLCLTALPLDPRRASASA